MRAFLNILFFIIIASCLAAPLITGFVVENRYQKMISKLNEGYNGDVVFEGKFERGYFTSHATTIVVHSESDKLVLDHKVYNGPVVFKFKGWFQASNYKPQAFGLAVVETKILGPIADKVASLYQNNQAYDITTTVEFNGDSNTKFNNYPLTVVSQNKNIEWQGFTAKLKIANESTNIDLSLDAPVFKYVELLQNNFNRTLEFSNVKIEFKKTMSSSNEIIKLSVDEVKFSDDSTKSYLTVDDLAFKTDTTVVDKILNLDWDLTLNKMKMNSHEIGPFVVDLKMQKLNTATLKKLGQMPLPLYMVQPDISTIQSGITQEEILEFLNPRPIFDLSLECAMSLGKIDYVSHLEIGGPEINNLDWDKIWDTAVLSKKLNVSEAIVHKVLLSYAKQQLYNNEKMYLILHKDSTAPNPYDMDEQQRKNLLANWVNNLLYSLQQNKIIVEQDGLITIKLEFKNNELVINDKKITPQDIEAIKPMLIMPILSPPEPVVNTVSTVVPVKSDVGAVQGLDATPPSKIELSPKLGGGSVTSQTAPVSTIPAEPTPVPDSKFGF